ncbi:MAG: glycosyltransferase family A protein [Acidobacteriota bacterium]
MTISVIIPLYNCERYIGEAIESAISQSYRPVEIIVMDDGSTDGSREAVERFGSQVKYIYQPNSGQAAARNRAIEMAAGEFLAFLDADDVWLEDKLKIQMAAFDANARLDAVFGHIEQFHSPELDEEWKKKTRCPSEPLPGVCPSVILIRRESFLRVGMFETQLRVGEFQSWYMRAVEAGLRSLMLTDVVARRRLHDRNNGIVRREDFDERLQILKAALDRRRASSSQSDER